MSGMISLRARVAALRLEGELAPPLPPVRPEGAR